MSHTPHDLAAEFPEHAQKMHDLRTSDAHFAKLHEAYDAANSAVHLAETDLEPTSDDHLTDLRKTRLMLKDQIYAYLTK